MGPMNKYSHDNQTGITVFGQCSDRVTTAPQSDRKVHESFLSCNAPHSNNPPPFSLSCNRPNSPLSLSSEVHDNHANDALKNPIKGSIKSAAALRPYLLGIDPGLTGACALINGDCTPPEIVEVWDIPTVKISKGTKGKQKTLVDILMLALKIDGYASMIKVCLIEEVGSRPGEGHVGAFSFGFSTGAIHGVLNTCLIPTKTVKPSVWKPELGLSSDKQESIDRAIKVLPASKPFLTRKKDHGRAEALLLAWYAWRKLNVTH